MDILILGHKGMLGHMLMLYLTDQKHSVHIINHRYPSEEFKQEILNFTGDYIINCIGAIPQKTSDFNINFELPIWLDSIAKCKIIHPGTDCEMDNDMYGISKRKASDYIKSYGTRTKIIKTSIIGPELNSKDSLFEWFINSSKEVHGHTNAMWNGNTTYEWSKFCNRLILNWDNYDIETILYGECISKYNLLVKIGLVFNKKIIILPIEKGINKCLKGHIHTPNMDIQLMELKKYYYDNRRIS